MNTPVTHHRWAATGVALLIAVCAMLAAASPALGATITGRIRNDAGAVPGARVEALNPASLSVVASTTAVADPVDPTKTMYTLTVPGGTYILRATDPATSLKPSYSGKVALNLAEAVPVTVAGNATLDRQDLRIFTVGAVTGKVTDAVGNPLQGVKIEAWLNDGPPEGWGVAHFTYTDANGDYELNLDTLHFDYVLAYRDLTSQHRSVVYPAGQDLDDGQLIVPVTNMTMPLSPVSLDWGTHITGALTSAMNSPANEFVIGGPADGIEAHVWMFENGEWIKSQMYWVENNIDGTFDIVGLWPGTYRLSFEDPHLPHTWFDKVYTVPDSKETSIALATDVTTSETTRTVNVTAEMWLFDDTAPFTQIAFTPAGSWVSAASVTASLTATDDIYGIAQTQYSLDGQPLAGYTEPFAITGEGMHTVEYRSTDLAGNTEALKSAQIGIDTSAPSASIVGTQPDWYTEAASISISATDSVSGVAAIRYRVNDGAIQTYSGAVTIAEEGVHQLQYWAVDLAGNESAPQTLTVKVDLGAPVVSSNIDDTWRLTPLQVTLSANDAAGIASIGYRIAGGADQVYSGPFTVDAEGATVVEYWAVDVLGNTSPTVAKSVKIDRVAPVTTSNAVSAYNDSATITFSPSDTHSGVAGTRYRVNGGAETSGTSVAISVPGTHSVSFWSFDRAGNVETPKSATFSITATKVTAVNVSGANRFATAAAASKLAFPDGAPTVIVVASDKWADSVAAAPLAGAAGGPILLTSRDTLAPATLAEIRRLKATSAYIVGGTASVGTPVENALRTEFGGSTKVTRIAGADRYVVADAAARRALTVSTGSGGTWDGTAILVTGRDFPDALTVAPVSARKVWPTLLAEPDGLGSVTDRTVTNAKSMGVKRIVVVGGDRSVTPEAVTKFTAAGIPMQIRLSGADRYAASVAVARWAVGNHGFGYNRLALANGLDFPDPLAGGFMQARAGSVLLLTRGDRLDGSVDSLLRQQKGKISEIRFIGGTTSLTTTVRSAAIAAATP